MREIISKAAAIERGLDRFYTGRKCANGHYADRRVKDGLCCICIVQYRRSEPTMLKDQFRKTRDRALRDGVPFNLTLDYVQSIWPADNKCPVLGLTFARSRRGEPRMASPSIDRLKPELGYVEGNVAVISHFANAIKSNATSRQVVRVANWMKTQGL